jgi:probable phosphoglycerate mutase
MPTRHHQSFEHAGHRLRFIRHGATQPNLAGLRCGGDLDVPLTDVGRRQAADAAHRLVEMGTPIGVIVSSDLQRTCETARIIAEAFGAVETLIVPGFAERHLGDWNLRPIAETEADIVRGETPPGGESNEQFFERIAAAIETLLPHQHRQPLLVASKGVARALGELLGQPVRHGLANGELTHFDLAAFARRSAQRCPA